MRVSLGYNVKLKKYQTKKKDTASIICRGLNFTGNRWECIPAAAASRVSHVYFSHSILLKNYYECVATALLCTTTLRRAEPHTGRRAIHRKKISFQVHKDVY